MDRSLIDKVKKKREFSQLPDSIVKRALEISKWDVKEARAYLRKYFGVFLTNRVLKPRDLQNWNSVLKSHISSKNRDYEKLYSRIFKGREYINSIVDLGCGVNGFSLLEIHKASGAIEYFGIEASKQLVDLMNEFFKGKGYNAHAVWLDLFDLKKVIEVIRKVEETKAIFCFQVVDALESFKKDFSKEFILEVSKEMNEKDIFVISNPIRSISGKKTFGDTRKWLIDFINENFNVLDDFEMSGERFISFRNKSTIPHSS